MVNKELSFPVLAFKEKQASMYAIPKKEFGFVSKGQGNFYKGLTIIDCTGNIYKVTGVNTKGRAPFLTSLKSLQAMEEVNIEVETTGSITLEELKQKIVAHIHKHPKAFEPHYNGEPWTKRLEGLTSFEETISLFK
jgi:hypothetical protein